MSLRKYWEKIDEYDMLLCASALAAAYLLYISTLNIYFQTPVTENELRMTQGILGFCFLFLTMLIVVIKPKKKR